MSLHLFQTACTRTLALSALLWAIPTPCNHTVPLGSISFNLTTDHNDIHNQYRLWRFLSHLICQPVHHQSERDRAQRWYLLHSYLHLEKKASPLASEWKKNERKLSCCEELIRQSRDTEKKTWYDFSLLRKNCECLIFNFTNILTVPCYIGGMLCCLMFCTSALQMLILEHRLIS